MMDFIIWDQFKAMITDPEVDMPAFVKELAKNYGDAKIGDGNMAILAETYLKFYDEKDQKGVEETLSVLEQNAADVYRAYVDDMVNKGKLSHSDRDKIAREMAKKESKSDEHVLEKAAATDFTKGQLVTVNDEKIPAQLAPVDGVSQVDEKEEPKESVDLIAFSKLAMKLGFSLLEATGKNGKIQLHLSGEATVEVERTSEVLAIVGDIYLSKAGK